MKKVDLQFKIDGVYKTVDIDNKTTFAFNLQASDLTNPTATKIPFSTSVKLPMTQLNNDIFNHIYRIDHTINTYDPLTRTDFRLYINNNLYQSGYIKLEDIKDSYSVRLFGGLGDYFFTLKDTLLKDLDFGDTLNHNVDKEQIFNSFTGKPLRNNKGQNISDKLSYVMTYQGKYDNFDNDSIDTYSTPFQEEVALRSNEVVPVKWELNGKEFKSPDLTENHRRGTAKLYYINGEWVDYLNASKKASSGGSLQTKDVEYCGEYRSYYQKPAISINYIIKKSIEAAEKSGWTTILDPSFFNEENPYWSKLWVILNQYNTGDNTFSSNNVLDLPSIDKETLESKGGKIIYDESNLGNGTFYKGKMNSFYLHTDMASGEYLTKGNHLKMTIPFKTATAVVPNSSINYELDIPFKILTTMPLDEDDPKNKPMKKYCDYINKNNNYGLGISLELVCKDTSTNKEHRIRLRPEVLSNRREITRMIITRDTNITNRPGRLRIQRPNWQQLIKGSRVWYYSQEGEGDSIFRFKGKGSIPSSFVKSDTVEFSIDFIVDGTTAWRRNSHSWSKKYGARFDIDKEKVHININQSIDDTGVTDEGKMPINAKDLFRTNKTAYDLVTSYAKMFGLVFVKDEASKTVSILTRNTYFSKLESLDWTHKIDRGSINIKPVPFDYKVGIFRYNNKGSKYEESYTNEFNRDYGSLNFDNGSAFNTEDKDYIENILFDNGIVVSDYSKYFLGRSGEMYRDDKALFHFEDKDNSKIDAEYVLAFKEDKPTKLKNYYLITDDTPLMLSEGRCWNDISFEYADEYIRFNKSYKKGDTTYSLNFGRPRIGYTRDEEELTSDDNTKGFETLYSKFWKTFINDRFNKNNKILTADFDLNLNDFNEDLFNKFIVIDNVVWVINKIDKFDPTKDKLTRVELVKVEDKENYVRQNYNSSNFKITKDGEVIYDFFGEIGSTPVIIKVDDRAQTVKFTVETKGGFSAGGDLDITPSNTTNDTTEVSINVPTGSSGDNYNFNFSWGGGNSTQVSIIQASNWKVNVSSNYGTAYVNGVANGTDVKDESSVIFTTEAEGYEFSHWLINGEVYSSQSVTINKVESNIDGEAIWYDPKRYTKVVVEDPNTKIKGSLLIDNFYILEIGKEYEIQNNLNVSGYQWSDDHFTISTKRVIKETDKVLRTFYDSILINGTINNKSDNNFEDLDYLDEPLEEGESSIYTKVGSITKKRYDNQYLIFSTEDKPTLGINTIDIDVHNVGWLGDKKVALLESNKLETKVYSPIEFTLTYDKVEGNIEGGTEDTDVELTLNYQEGKVIQTVGEYEYTLELTNTAIKPIGWNGKGDQNIYFEVPFDQTSSKGRMYFNQFDYTLKGLKEVGDVVSEDTGSKYIELELEYGINKVQMQRTIKGSVFINEVEYTLEVLQEAAPDSSYNLSIIGDAEASTMTDFKSDTKLEIKVNQAENAHYAVQANLAIKANHSSKSDQLMNARKIQVGNYTNEFDGTKDIHYTLKDIGAVPKIDYDNLVDKVEDLANNQGNNKLYVDLLSDQYIQGTKTFDETKIELLDSKFQPTLIIERVNESKFELKYYYNGNVDTPPLIEQTVLMVNNTINVNLYKNGIVWKYIILHNPTNYNNGIFNFTTIRNSVQKYFIFNGNDNRAMRIYHTNGRDHTISAGECQTLMSVPTRFMTPRPDPNKPGYGMLLCSYYDNNWQ